jgi:acetyl/propionyl-CoA carboxylase alpha subunit
LLWGVDTVSMHYDPMIAKLLVWGENRAAALVKLKDCLSKFEVYLITGLLVKVSGILDFRVASQQCDSLL